MEVVVKTVKLTSGSISLISVSLGSLHLFLSLLGAHLVVTHSQISKHRHTNDAARKVPCVGSPTAVVGRGCELLLGGRGSVVRVDAPWRASGVLRRLCAWAAAASNSQKSVRARLPLIPFFVFRRLLSSFLGATNALDTTHRAPTSGPSDFHVPLHVHRCCCNCVGANSAA